MPLTAVSSRLEDQKRIQRIEDILFPEGAHDQSQLYDVEIIFKAAKRAWFLVTAYGESSARSGGILEKAANLKEAVGVHLVDERRAVEIVLRRVHDRDVRCRWRQSEYGDPLPEWVGQD